VTLNRTRERYYLLIVASRAAHWKSPSRLAACTIHTSICRIVFRSLCYRYCVCSNRNNSHYRNFFIHGRDFLYRSIINRII